MAPNNSKRRKNKTFAATQTNQGMRPPPYNAAMQGYPSPNMLCPPATQAMPYSPTQGFVSYSPNQRMAPLSPKPGMAYQLPNQVMMPRSPNPRVMPSPQSK